MSTIQLDPPLPMNCPKGEGFAHFLINDSPEADLYWVIFVTETGEIWTFSNKHVRASKNITLGRFKPLTPEELQRIGEAIFPSPSRVQL